MHIEHLNYLLWMDKLLAVQQTRSAAKRREREGTYRLMASLSIVKVNYYEGAMTKPKIASDPGTVGSEPAKNLKRRCLEDFLC